MNLKEDDPTSSESDHCTWRHFDQYKMEIFHFQDLWKEPPSNDIDQLLTCRVDIASGSLCIWPRKIAFKYEEVSRGKEAMLR